MDTDHFVHSGFGKRPDTVTITMLEKNCTDSDVSSSTSVIGSPQDGSEPVNGHKHPLPLRLEAGHALRYANSASDPRVSLRQKTQEGIRLAYTFTNATLSDLITSYEPISESHRFSRRIVEPLYTWKGKNARVITGQCLGTTTIQDETEGQREVIHAACQNYTGFCRPTHLSEELQKLCLDSLPVTEHHNHSALARAFHAAIADLFHADFCYTTSTGYGSNLLAFPAILDPSWVVVLDTKTHNSIHVGAYISNAGKILKFRHNDMVHLEQLLDAERQRYDHILVAVEGLYSMDGTIPPLSKLQTLKRRFNFVLLADEAHSVLTLGKTGRGCLEFWNDSHQEAPVDEDLIDIRTAALSKSFGAIGGLVCGKARFESAVAARHDQLIEDGADPVLSATMTQCLRVLLQPTALQQRLGSTRHMAMYARGELHRCGLHIYGEAATPVLPIHTGRPFLAAKLSYLLRKRGVLAIPISKPATPFWQSRVRVCVSADHTEEQITTLVRSIVDAAVQCGITKSRCVPRPYESPQGGTLVGGEAMEELAASERIKELIQQAASSSHRPKLDPSTIQAGHQTRQNCGLATGGARWISGTFSIHVEAESLISSVIQVAIPHALTLTYSESYLSIVSTIAALCRPICGRTKHTMLIPTDVPEAVLDGIKAAPTKSKPDLQHFHNTNELVSQIAGMVRHEQQVTVYLPSPSIPAAMRHLSTNVKRCGGTRSKYLTILIHDTTSILKSAKARQILTKSLNILRQLTRNVVVLGSFMQNFGVPGAYLTGCPQIVEEFRYSSRGYMFSSAPLPCTVGMAVEQLRNPT